MDLGNFLGTIPELTTNGAPQTELHARAAASAREVFGRNVFVRGVLEISNYCRQDCAYCGMRRSNRELKRYRAQVEQLAELVLQHRPDCVTDINLQAGEDPVVVREVAIPLIRQLRRESSLGISVCLGTLDHEVYRELQAAGASIYIMKFECADERDYARFQCPGTLQERIAHIQWLAAEGWAVSSGFIAGLPGQAPDSLRKNLELAASLPLRGCSVSPFVPGSATPLAQAATVKPNWTTNCIAAMRLWQPEWIIPAVSALNLAEPEGYLRGLAAGANLVTINLTPETVRRDYVIYKRDRFIMTEERVVAALAALGLQPATTGLAAYYRERSKLGAQAGCAVTA